MGRFRRFTSRPGGSANYERYPFSCRPLAPVRIGGAVARFAADPIAGAPDHGGEFEIWARDKSSGDLVALPIPTAPASLKVHAGGLKIQGAYPEEVIFTPCTSGHAQVHDKLGFARRPDQFDDCN